MTWLAIRAGLKCPHHQFSTYLEQGYLLILAGSHSIPGYKFHYETCAYSNVQLSYG